MYAVLCRPVVRRRLERAVGAVQRWRVCDARCDDGRVHCRADIYGWLFIVRRLDWRRLSDWFVRHCRYGHDGGVHALSCWSIRRRYWPRDVCVLGRMPERLLLDRCDHRFGYDGNLLALPCWCVLDQRIGDNGGLYALPCRHLSVVE